jgi:hypothetical protein
VLFVLALIGAISAVDGCAHPVEPIGPALPTLLPGAYTLVVEDVTGVSCGPHVRAREIVGARLPARVLAGHDGRAALHVSGWKMEGEHGAGWFVAEGTLAPEVPVHTQDDVVVSEPGEPGEPDVHDTSRREAACMDVPDDEPREEPVPPSGPYAAVELEVFEERYAEGSLLLSMPDCEMDLRVTLHTEEGEPPPVEPMPGEEDAP